MLEKISLLVSIIAILSISLFSLSLNPIKIHNNEEIPNLRDNQRVILETIIIKEKNFGNSKLLLAENNISLICDKKCPFLIKKKIIAEGKIESYNDLHLIKLMKIKY